MHDSSFGRSMTVPGMFPSQVMIALGDYMDAQCHACIGGTNVRTDIAKLEMGQHIVVGTPGRVFDMIQRKALGEWMGLKPTVLTCKLITLDSLVLPAEYWVSGWGSND